MKKLTIEQLIDECCVDCATDDELYERLEYIELAITNKRMYSVFLKWLNDDEL